MGGGRGEVQDRVHGPVEKDVLRDVVEDEAVFPVSREMGDVPLVPGDEIVETDHFVPFGEKPIGQVAAEEARGSGDDDAHQARPSPT